jgi:hypothetical protein
MKREQEIRKWRVRLEYRTVLRLEVETHSEESAIAEAESQINGNLIACEAQSYSADAEEIE